MRSVSDIEADIGAHAPPITLAHVADWEWYCERVTAAEVDDVALSAWLALCATHRGHGALDIPADVAADPRLSSASRHVLAALLDVARDVDLCAPEVTTAARARLFGACADSLDLEVYGRGLGELVGLGIVCRTTRGGFFRRAAA